MFMVFGVRFTLNGNSPAVKTNAPRGPPSRVTKANWESRVMRLFPAAAPTHHGEHDQYECQRGGPYRGFGGEEVEDRLDDRDHREEGKEAREGVALEAPPCFAGGIVIIAHSPILAITLSRHRP